MVRGEEVKAKQPVTSKDLQTYMSMLVERAKLASRMGGQQYGGDRNIYQALGYKTELTYNDFYDRYTRQDIAKAIIDRPVKATWQGDLELVETEDAKETPFESGWKKLNWDLGLKTRLSRVDRLTGIGRYGILLLGLDDVKNNEGFKIPVQSGTRKLMYVKPFGEDSAKVVEYEKNPSNDRYGMPLMYGITVADVAMASVMEVKVHYTRIVHVVDDNMESEVLGTPRLEAVFNRLMDLEKIVGGDAEMFWRGARPGYEGKVDPDFTLTAEAEKDLKEQLDEYENGLRRFLINQGIDINALAQQIADPLNHVDAQIQMISAVTGIPKRILTGSERGELSSAQDTGEWKTYIQSRREDHAEPRIIRPFIDRIIELKILPAPNKFYRIDWLDLFSISEKERVEIGKARANAIREYTTNPMAEALVPADLFLETCLGYSQGQIEFAKTQRAAGISEEQKSLMEDIIDITTPAKEEPVKKETTVKKDKVK